MKFKNQIASNSKQSNSANTPKIFRNIPKYVEDDSDEI